jgi:hypothetical protein
MNSVSKTKFFSWGKAYDDISVMQEKVLATAALFKTGNFQRCFQHWKTCWTLRIRVQGAYSVGSTYRKKFQPILLFITSQTSQDAV